MDWSNGLFVNFEICMVCRLRDNQQKTQDDDYNTFGSVDYQDLHNQNLWNPDPWCVIRDEIECIGSMWLLRNHGNGLVVLLSCVSVLFYQESSVSEIKIFRIGICVWTQL